MKIILVLLVVCLCWYSAGAQTKNPCSNRIDKEIIESLQTKDFAKYRKMILTYDEFVNELAPVMLNDTVHKLPKQRITQAADLYKEQVVELNQILFTTILSTGDSLGIKAWEKIELEHISFQGNPDSASQFDKSLDAQIQFSFGSRHFLLWGITMAMTSLGCRLLMIQGLAEKK
jgi:hypothetical protein